MRRNRRAPKIKWSLFFSFTAVTSVILILVWVIQLLLLSFVYEWTTQSRMRVLLDDISHTVAHEENFEAKALAQAEKGWTDMAIYRARGEGYEAVVQTDGEDGVLSLLDAEDISRFFKKTESSRSFQEKVGDLFGKERFSPAENRRLLSAATAEGVNGEAYLILLDTESVPLRHLFSLLQNQLLLMSLILLAVSLVIAFLLSRHIASPIERISKKASYMAKGNYNIDFSEKSYREIEELSETLNRTSSELSKIDSMQKELIANISHDLRTPLTMIVGYAEVMRDIEGENTPENMQVIIDEATRLSTLVNDLLEISRIQGGSAARKNESFDLAELAETTVERYRRLKENGGFTFDFETIGEAFVVYADKMKISQVLCNLLNNAVNYSDADRRIAVRVISNDGRVRLEVEDHGVGIAPENIETVWQRYYRGEKNHRRSIAGSGLGLSIVREILELHRAKYGVSSVLGEGSVFWFELLHEDKNLSPECI